MMGETVGAGLFQMEKLGTESVGARNACEKFLCLCCVFEETEDVAGVCRFNPIDSFEDDSGVAAPAGGPFCDDDASAALCSDVVKRAKLFDEFRLEEQSAEFPGRFPDFNPPDAAAHPALIPRCEMSPNP
jgi:hypothetical protein